MTTKFERQGTILRLVQQQPLSTQAEVADALRANGIDAVQATVSRDIAQLGLVKVRNGDGRLVYALPGRRRPRPPRRARPRALRRWMGESVAVGDAARDPDAARLRRRARRRDRRRRPAGGRGHDRRRQHRLRRLRATASTPAELDGRAAEPPVSVTRAAPASILGSLPVGERVGIAFSGGLDTSCALAWMRENGAIPYAFTADLGQYDEPDIDAVPAKALAVRRRGRGARRLQGRARARRARRAAVRRVPHPDGRQALLQHDAARPRVTGTMLVQAMAEHGVDIWGDGSTYKGNDIERFYRYGLLVNEHLRIYKPWLDSAFVDELGGRKEMSEWLVERGLPHRASVEKAYSTDANMLGATHEAKDLELLETSMKIVEPIMGVAHWDADVAIEPEDVTIAFERGLPVVDRRRRVDDPVELIMAANAIGGRHGLGMSRPDREPHHRSEEPRHLRGARHGAAAHRLRAAAERDPQRGDARALRRRRPAARPAALRGPLVRRAGADAARRAAALGRGRRSPAR